MKRLFCSLLMLGILVAAAAKQYVPGDVVPRDVVAQRGVDSFFSVQEIPDSIFRKMQGKSYKQNCTVPRSTLRYLLCLHKDKDGVTKVGEMVLNKRIASIVLDIFKELYKNSYPIERMRLIDYWDADDERSMRANNTSGFNYRLVSNTTRVSKHGYGLAVDINPLYNPYVRTVSGKTVVEPATGKPYADRTKVFDYKLVKGDLCYRLFIQHGFRWGGGWKYSKDYQHFDFPI